MSTQVYIAFARKGVILDKQLDKKGFHCKKASLETLTARENERKYTRRANVCSECFTAKSIKTGECNCY